jgi:hypothetical protein
MRRDDGNPLPAVFIELKRTLLVTGLQAILVGKNPDLQEVHRFGLRCVVLAVADSRTRAHALHVADSDNRARARAVFVRQSAFEHIRDNFHVAMRMGRKTFAGHDPVFIDYPESSETHVLVIIILAERESMAAVEPAPLGVPSIITATDCNHMSSLPNDLRENANCVYQRGQLSLVVNVLIVRAPQERAECTC